MQKFKVPKKSFSLLHLHSGVPLGTSIKCFLCDAGMKTKRALIQEKETMRITKIKYFSEFRDINVTLPRKPEQPLPAIRDLLTFGSARRWMVTNTEQREDTLWVWLGTP